MKILFMGSQGSGKGTQAGILAKTLKIPSISTGDLFRNAKSELRRELDTYMNFGKLVPDELTTKILKQRLEQQDAQRGFILDGFPRTLSQVKLLKQIIDIDKVILINISDETAIKRISGRVTCQDCNESYNIFTEPKSKSSEVCNKCGGKLLRRADDNEESVKERLHIYHLETEPMLKKYNDRLIRINGEQSIEDINMDIKKKLMI